MYKKRSGQIDVCVPDEYSGKRGMHFRVTVRISRRKKIYLIGRTCLESTARDLQAFTHWE